METGSWLGVATCRSEVSWMENKRGANLPRCVVLRWLESPAISRDACDIEHANGHMCFSMRNQSSMVWAFDFRIDPAWPC